MSGNGLAGMFHRVTGFMEQHETDAAQALKDRDIASNNATDMAEFLESWAGQMNETFNVKGKLSVDLTVEEMPEGDVTHLVTLRIRKWLNSECVAGVSIGRAMQAGYYVEERAGLRHEHKTFTLADMEQAQLHLRDAAEQWLVRHGKISEKTRKSQYVPEI